MSDQRITIAPLVIAPLKKKPVLEVIWEAIGGYVLFFGGLWLGWLCRGVVGQ